MFAESPLTEDRFVLDNMTIPMAFGVIVQKVQDGEMSEAYDLFSLLVNAAEYHSDIAVFIAQSLMVLLAQGHESFVQYLQAEMAFCGVDPNAGRL